MQYKVKLVGRDHWNNAREIVSEFVVVRDQHRNTVAYVCGATLEGAKADATLIANALNKAIT